MVKLKADGPEGFTRRGLAAAISAAYQRIYREEDATAPAPPSASPFLLNRGFSNGELSKLQCA